MTMCDVPDAILKVKFKLFNWAVHLTCTANFL
jgi:hypothetical protein